MNAARAAVAAAEAIRQIDDVELKDETRAIGEQLSALAFLSRFDPNSRGQIENVVESLKEDPRPEMARIAAVEEFKLQIGSARSAAKGNQL